MKPISIMWSEGVSEEEAAQAVYTVQEIVTNLFEIEQGGRLRTRMPEIRPFGTWVIPAVPRDAAYWGTQWYVERALDPTQRRVRAAEFLRLVQHEPWQMQAPHFDLALLDFELMVGDETADAPLALTLPGTATVISVVPLRALQDRNQRLLALRRLVAHQLGHLVQVPRPDRTIQISHEHGETHCTAICAMRHASDPLTLLRYAQEEIVAGGMYCTECRRDLQRQLATIHFSLN